MHQLEIIENDLKQLQAETKKKHGPLKESLNNSLIVFQSYKNSQDRDNASSFPIGEIMRSIEMIPATKNEKIIVPALNMFKNMLNYGYLKDKYLLSVLNFLATSLEIPDDNIQVKLIQTILLFVTPNHLDFNRFELIEKLFNLTLQMYNSKNIIIHNTASAALFQLSSIIFDHFTQYIKANKIPGAAPQEEEKSGLDPSFYQKSIKLLREFIMIINGLRPDWSPQNVSIPRNTGLDILNSILKRVGSTLKYSKEAHQLIKKELIPILSNCFEPKSNDFPALVRIGRATSRIILSLHDGIELIDHLISLLNHSETDFEKYLCVETLTLVASSTDIMKMLNERHISTISYYSEILNSFLKLSKEVSEDPEVDRRRYTPLNSKLQRLLDSDLTEYETPQITTTHIYKALTEFFISGTEAFIFLSERCEFKLGVADNTATKHDQKNFVEWLTATWKPTLKCLKFLLPKQVDETMTQSLLNTFQKMISLTGSLGLTQARDSYIITLCQNCLPYDDHSLKELTLKNIQATKTVFNIAHCFGSILDINSWHSIFITLQKTEILFDRIRTQITPFLVQNAANRLSINKTEQDKDAVKRLITQEDENSLLLDLQIMSAALDSLFTQSAHYPLEHFKSFMEALNQLCLEYMEKVTTSETLIIEGVTIDGKAKIFGLSRMLETILVNLDRIEALWDLIVAHYVCIASNAKNVILRNRGVENLNTLTEKAFQYFMHKKAREPIPQVEENNGDDSGEKENVTEEVLKRKKTLDLWTRENWQKTLFQPWLEISKTKFPDVKENICQALLRLLQNNGHEINQEGWIVIACILQELSHDSMGTAVHIGFRCLEMIINDYLQEIGIDSVKILINVTENFKKISSDNNMSYQSVGMFWKIGDYLAKVQDQEQKKGREGMDGFDEAWILILNRLALFASDEHSELRTSAIHTLTNLMVHHGFILGMPLWNRVLNDLIFKLVDEVFEVYMTLTRVETAAPSSNVPKFGASKGDPKDAANREEKNKNLKQWEDTLTILMQNLLKIVKKYIGVIEKMPNLSKSSPEITILKNVLIKVKGFIMVARNELIAESIKLLHEIMLTKPEILSIMIDTVFDALSIVRTFLIENRQDGKEIKTIISKFIPEVLEILGEIFSPQRYAILNPQRIPYSKNLFDILEKAIFYSKQAETFNSISLNTKIITDVKPVYDFIEKIPTMLCENNDEMIKQYFEFIIHILSLPVSDKFTDLVIRKFVGILENVITGKVFDESVYFPYLPVIFEKLRSLLCLRCNNEFLTLMVNTSKNTLPIWLHVTDYFHNIAAHVLECYSNNVKKAEADPEQSNQDVLEKGKQLIYQIVEIYEVVLKSAEKSFDNISKSLLIEIKKNWFEMDMKFINSIGNTLVPNFTLMDPELLWRLIHILDFTFSFYSKNPMFVEQTGAYNATYGRDPAASSTISKITLEILFKISEGYQDEVASGKDQSSEEVQKRTNLSKLATKKLIFKCRRILNRYVYDEKRSGNMPLPKNRLLEICYILERLAKLNIPKNSFIVKQTDDLNATLQKSVDNYSCIIPPEDEEEEGLGNGSLINLQSGTSKLEEIALIPINSHPDMDVKILNGSKGHLIYLMPLFSECITCREVEIKEHLRKIFLEISKGLGVLSF